MISVSKPAWMETLAQGVSTANKVDVLLDDALRAGDSTIKALTRARDASATASQLIDDGLSQYRLHGQHTQGGVQLLEIAGSASNAAAQKITDWIQSPPSARDGIDALAQDVRLSLRQSRFAIDTVLPG